MNDPAEESTGSAVPLPKKGTAPAVPPPNMWKSPFESPELEASEDLVGEGPKLKKLILRPMSIDLKLFIKSNVAANESFYPQIFQETKNELAGSRYIKIAQENIWSPLRTTW